MPPCSLLSSPSPPPLFKGQSFSLLGHGSRSYPTFFQNPAKLLLGMTKMGGSLVATVSGEEAVDSTGLLSPNCIGVGVADASSKTPDDAVARDAWILDVVVKIDQVAESIDKETLAQGVARRQQLVSNRQAFFKLAEALCRDEVAEKRKDLISAGVLERTEGKVRTHEGGMLRYVLIPLLLGVIAVLIGIYLKNA